MSCKVVTVKDLHDVQLELLRLLNDQEADPDHPDLVHPDHPDHPDPPDHPDHPDPPDPD